MTSLKSGPVDNMEVYLGTYYLNGGAFNQAYLLSQPSWGYVASVGAQLRLSTTPNSSHHTNSMGSHLAHSRILNKYLLNQDIEIALSQQLSFPERVKHTPTATRQKYSPTAQAMEGGGGCGKEPVSGSSCHSEGQHWLPSVPISGGEQMKIKHRISEV